ncbi:HIRAN domain-containing protein [Bacillus sp. AGMB 02131]|uniref:HIRAN domain-containing protein n=1 Tax=Peribacillus faecalis TaxID=2772559 RepID=A0A927D2Y3_9BACI|nr:HIRAN domain-containing protein [Peribacillus faecalis]MBD3110114.1 HIRAN domain-containing protein [Peribacillus faecalis]
MADFYISVVGVNHYFGSDIFKVGQKLMLKKDLENKYDDEAIQVELGTIGKVGYVANSYQTVAKGTRSAGRIYDTFDTVCKGQVAFIVKDTIIVKLLPDEIVTAEQ